MRLTKLSIKYKLNKRMKKLIRYLIILSSVLILLSCDKPAPTQLVDDSTDQTVEYEVLSKDVTDEYYSNGGDTTGVTQDLKDFPNLISLSGVKETDINGTAHEYSFGQTIVFDRTKPVYDSHMRLLAYHTITPGVIRIENIREIEVPFHIRYRDNGVLIDTTLGNKYILFSRLHPLFQYRHNARLNFRLTFLNNDFVNFDIKTPKEITGKVELLGKRADGNLRAKLNWNKENSQDVEIVISGRLINDRKTVMPLYRIKTNDSGELVIPARLISQIPRGQFDRLVFTFIRRLEEVHTSGENDLRISSQSIHSITISLP